jgi:hypothetical protein
MQITTGLFGNEFEGKWLEIYANAEHGDAGWRLNALFREVPRYPMNGCFSETLWAKLYIRIREHY